MLFEKHRDAERREFCELFGPEKIAENLKGFVGYFMVRKVMCGADLKRMAGTVTQELCEWLAEQGYDSQEGTEKTGQSTRSGP